MPYFCSKCQRVHSDVAAVGQDHVRFKVPSEPDPTLRGNLGVQRGD